MYVKLACLGTGEGHGRGVLEKAAGLLKHEVINLVSSEKKHYGGNCSLTGQGCLRTWKRKCSEIQGPGSRRGAG